jgi:hypothetical protein
MATRNQTRREDAGDVTPARTQASPIPFEQLVARSMEHWAALQCLEHVADELQARACVLYARSRYARSRARGLSDAVAALRAEATSERAQFHRLTEPDL